MTPDQIQLVQSSFSKVAPIAEDAAAIFYGRLFEVSPELKPLFKGDLFKQGRKLMTTLGVVVNGLKNLDAVLPVARELAIRHVDYGVKAEDYQPVGEALVWALEKGLGDAFTEKTKQAWIAAYGALSTVMIEAAYPGASSAAE